MTIGRPRVPMQMGVERMKTSWMRLTLILCTGASALAGCAGDPFEIGEASREMASPAIPATISHVDYSCMAFVGSANTATGDEVKTKTKAPFVLSVPLRDPTPAERKAGVSGEASALIQTEELADSLKGTPLADHKQLMVMAQRVNDTGSLESRGLFLRVLVAFRHGESFPGAIGAQLYETLPEKLSLAAALVADPPKPKSRYLSRAQLVVLCDRTALVDETKAKDKAKTPAKPSEDKVTKR
jgi:hypothetical protein